jgi:hypothetical protein
MERFYIIPDAYNSLFSHIYDRMDCNQAGEPQCIMPFVQWQLAQVECDRLNGKAPIGI